MARQNKGLQMVKNAMSVLGKRATVTEVSRYLFKGRAGVDAPSRAQIAMAMKKVGKDTKKGRPAKPKNMIVAKSAKRGATAKMAAGGPTQIFRLGQRALQAAAQYIQKEHVVAGRKKASTSGRKQSKRAHRGASKRGRKPAARRSKGGHRTRMRWAAVSRRRAKTSKRR